MIHTCSMCGLHHANLQAASALLGHVRSINKSTNVMLEWRTGLKHIPVQPFCGIAASHLIDFPP